MTYKTLALRTPPSGGRPGALAPAEGPTSWQAGLLSLGSSARQQIGGETKFPTAGGALRPASPSPLLSVQGVWQLPLGPLWPGAQGARCFQAAAGISSACRCLAQPGCASARGAGRGREGFSEAARHGFPGLIRGLPSRRGLRRVSRAGEQAAEAGTPQGARPALPQVTPPPPLPAIPPTSATPTEPQQARCSPGMLPPPSPRCHFPSSELGGRPELHKQEEEQRPGEGRPPDPAKTRGCALALPPPRSRTALYFESRQGAARGARPAGARAHGTDGGRNAEASGGGAFMRRGRWGRGHERFPTLGNQSAARTGRSAGAPVR